MTLLETEELALRVSDGVVVALLLESGELCLVVLLFRFKELKFKGVDLCAKHERHEREFDSERNRDDRDTHAPAEIVREVEQRVSAELV